MERRFLSQKGSVVWRGVKEKQHGMVNDATMQHQDGASKVWKKEKRNTDVPIGYCSEYDFSLLSVGAGMVHTQDGGLKDGNIGNGGVTGQVYEVGRESGMKDALSSYVNKLNHTSLTKANLRELDATVPNDADYDVWLPVASVHKGQSGHGCNDTFSLSNSFDALNVENSVSDEVETSNRAYTSCVQEEEQSSAPLGVGYGTKSLLEQLRETYVNDDYDPYNDDMYEGQDIPDNIQSICDNLDIKVIPLPLTGIDRKIKGGTRNQRQVKSKEQDTKGKKKAHNKQDEAKAATRGTKGTKQSNEYGSRPNRQNHTNSKTSKRKGAQGNNRATEDTANKRQKPQRKAQKGQSKHTNTEAGKARKGQTNTDNK
ncbi:hypothetical protein Tco_0163874 [Tanacetum coccineum]